MASVLQTKDRVQRFLGQLVGSVEVTADGVMTFQYESTRVFISVSGDGDATFVTITGIVLVGAASTSDNLDDELKNRFGGRRYAR